MAKLSGLIERGKVGKANQKVVDAMPEAPENINQDSVLEGRTYRLIDTSVDLEVGMDAVPRHP